MAVRRWSALIRSRPTGVGSGCSRGDVDGTPGGVGRIRTRLRDHPDDADDRALLAGVVEERTLALLHGAQVVLCCEVADACPLRSRHALWRPARSTTNRQARTSASQYAMAVHPPSPRLGVSARGLRPHSSRPRGLRRRGRRRRSMPCDGRPKRRQAWATSRASATCSRTHADLGGGAPRTSPRLRHSDSPLPSRSLDMLGCRLGGRCGHPGCPQAARSSNASLAGCLNDSCYAPHSPELSAKRQNRTNHAPAMSLQWRVARLGTWTSRLAG